MNDGVGRSLATGAAFGLAVAIVETGLAASQMMKLGMPPLTTTMVLAGFLQIVLGSMLGALSHPLRRVLGAFGQVIAIAAVWLLLARTVAPDPSMIAMWATGAIAGLVLTALGGLLARWMRPLPWILGVAMLAATILYPDVSYRGRTDSMVAGMTQATPREDAPDVIIVVLDTVRAANVSAYGYARETTPVLSALADEGALFLDATSPSTWSLPSHASLFTGWFPSGHNTHGEHRVLADQLPTLAEVLYRSGYDTRCFTANAHISDGFGLTRGFAYSDRAYLSGGGIRSFVFIFRLLDLFGYSVNDKGGSEVAGNFEHWAASRPADGPPTFAFLNFLEAHFPYHQVPYDFLAKFTVQTRSSLRKFSLNTFGAQFGRNLSKAEAEAAREPVRNMYDAGVLYSDYLLKRVVDAQRKAGRLDRTVLVVLADHGEMLGEHGNFGHGRSLYQPDIHVPLLVRFPPSVGAGIRVTEPVSTTGVYATVLDLVGIESPGSVQSPSLLPALEGRAVNGPVIAERFVNPSSRPDDVPLLSGSTRYRVFRSGKLKLVIDSTGKRFLFDLNNDPGELDNVAASRAGDLARLQDELDAWTDKLGLPELDAEIDFGAAPELDDATADRLRALGYLE